MTLVKQLQAELTDLDKPLESILLKCQIVAARLDAPSFEHWVDWEQNGYPDGTPTPEYRSASCCCMAHLSDGVRVINNHTFDFSHTAHLENLMDVCLRDPVAALVEMLRSGRCALAIPDRLVGFIQKTALQPGVSILQIWREVTMADISGMLASVRAKLLAFLLDIEKTLPEFDGETPLHDPAKSREAQQIFNVTVYDGNVAVGESVTQINYKGIQAGNWESLRGFLEDKEIEKSDLDLLQEALKEDPRPAGRKLGPKTSSWIGGMVTKAASGIWQVGVATAGNLLAKAILMYYGISG